MNAVPLTNISAEKCVGSFVRHWVTLFGTPEHIFTDRGTQLISSLWLSMCNYLGAQQHHATAYHPQAQGQIDRLNRTLKNSLRCQDNANEWYDNLPWALMALRNSPKEDLGNFLSLILCLVTLYDSPGNSTTLVTTMALNPILMLLSASLDIMSHPYVSCHPAKQIVPPTWTKICFHLLQPTSKYEWTLIVPPCNLYIKGPTKFWLNFPSI